MHLVFKMVMVLVLTPYSSLVGSYKNLRLSYMKQKFAESDNNKIEQEKERQLSSE